jgi:hypothetical protein
MSLSAPARESRDGSARGLDLLLGLGIGAAAMYYFDPDRGSERRSAARHGIRQAVTVAPETFESLAHDVGGWARQAIAEGPDGARESNDDWTPAGRLAASALGGLLTMVAAKRRDALGAAVGLMGSALLARGVGRIVSRGASARSEMAYEPVSREVGDAIERPGLLEQM